MLNYHRDHKKFSSMEALSKHQANLTPEDEVQAGDLESAIDNAIENMPEKRGTVFQLCFIEGFTYKEAAATLEVSVKTIENHMGLALKDMRQALKQYR